MTDKAAKTKSWLEPADAKGLNLRYLLTTALVAVLVAFTALSGGAGFHRDTQALLVTGTLLLFVFFLSIGAAVRVSRVHLVFAGLLGIYVLSSWTSFWPTQSLIESALLLGYLAVFLMGANVVGGDRRRWALHAMVLVGAAIAALGLFQHLSGYEAQIQAFRDLGYESQAVQLTVMSSAAFGNFPTANGFAGFMLLLIPVALGLAKYETDIRFRVWLGTAAVLMVAALYYSDSRSAVLALLLGLAAAASIWAGRFSRRRVAVALPVGAVLLGAALFGLLFRFRLDRVVGASQGRQELWRAAAAMVRDHPWSGVGAAGFGTAMSSYQSGSVFSPYTHNSYLQMAAEIGVPGLLVFLALLAVIFIGARRIFAAIEDRSSWLVLGLLAGLVAVAAHNAVDYSWHLPAVGLAFWWSAGLALGDEKTAPSAGTDAGPARMAAIGAALLLIAPLVLFTVSQSAASVANTRDPHFENESAEMDAVTAAFERALRFNPFDADTYSAYSAFLLDMDRKGYAASVEKAVRLQKRAVALRPGWPEYRWQLGRAEEASGREDRARLAYRRATTLGPKSPKVFMEYGDFALRNGYPQEALGAFRSAIGLEDLYARGQGFTELEGGRGDVVNPVREIARAYRGAANALIELKRYEEAKAAVAASERLVGPIPPVQFARGRVLEVQGDYEGAADAYGRAAYFETEAGEPKIHFAAAYRLLEVIEAGGDTAAAVAAAERLLEAAPSDPVALQVIERLESPQ